MSKKSKNTEGKEMSFWDHLDELRGALFRSAIVIVVFMATIFVFKDFVFNNIILAPTSSDFILYQWFCKLGEVLNMPSLCPDPFKVPIKNFDFAGQFFTHMSVSFWLGFLLGFPYLTYELWRFVSPALYPNEKRQISLAFAFGALLFFIGVAVGYFAIFPLTLRFLGTYQVSEEVDTLMSLSKYIGSFTWIVLIMGLVFQLPMIALVLSKLGIIHKAMLCKYRKYAILTIFVVSAVITPSGDAFTLCLVALPIILLYEFSIMLVKRKPANDEEADEVKTS